jgi:hypothetical protein
MQAPLFKALSNVTFIDNLKTRQLTERYLFSLFNRLID